MHRISTAITHRQSDYPVTNPFDASIQYPEFPSNHLSNERNDVYDMVRQTLIDLEMDKSNIGTESWSPFCELVTPGDVVVIKPNLVLNTADPGIQSCTTTHPSVIRPIIDYCQKALKGQGKIIVGDCPAAEADFNEIVSRTGLRDMIINMQKRGAPVELKDFRAVRVVTENGIWVSDQKNTDDIGKGKIVELGSESLLAENKYSKAKFHGAGYDIKETNRHHKGNTHRYCVSEDILSADVVISVTKFKTHRKAGITNCLKNLVGINADKNYLPHFSMGASNMGGDEMPEIPKNRVFLMRSYNWFREYILAYSWRIIGRPAVAFLRLIFKKRDHNRTQSDSTTGDAPPKDEDLARALHAKISKQTVTAGAWSGNETICAMILDLNRIFLCCDKDGMLKEKTDRRYFYIADAIEAGMGNGPTHPTPVFCGIIAAGWNGFSLDTSLLKLFNIDHKAIPLYRLAEKQEWIHRHGNGINLINGENLSGAIDNLPALIPPENWDFNPIYMEIN